MTSDYLYELLEQIKVRPEIYIGTKSLFRLRHFLDGVLHCLNDMQGLHLDRESDCSEFLQGFQEWIQMRYDICSDHHWSSIIIFYSYDEADAFDSFYDMLNEFLKLNDSEREYKKILLKTEKWQEIMYEYFEKKRDMEQSN